MKQTLFIHIGMPKTGTTSLQFFMARNRPKLKRHGIYYPATMRDPLPTATQHRYVNEFMRQQQKRVENGQPISPHVINRVAQEIERQGFATNLISEELFSYDPVFSAAYLARFRTRLDARIVVFLRRQDTWAESMYAQSIRGGYKAGFDSFLKAGATTERLDLPGFLEIWSEHFGRENVIVHVYRDRQTQSHLEMLSILGAPPLDSDVAEQRNPSLTGEAIEFIRGMSGLSKENYPKFNRLFAADLAGIAQKGSPVYFTRAARAAFLEQYRDGNAQVARDYLGGAADGEPLFGIDPETFPEDSRVVRDMTPERRLSLLQQLCDARNDGVAPAGASEGTPTERIAVYERELDRLCSESEVAV